MWLPIADSAGFFDELLVRLTGLFVQFARYHARRDFRFE